MPLQAKELQGFPASHRRWGQAWTRFCEKEPTL